MNNSLWDLYWQLLLFARTESRFAEIGIANLRDYINHAMGLDLEALSPAYLFPLLDAVSVGRTRSHIKKYFPDATITTPDGVVPLTFPEPQLHRFDYETARPQDAHDAHEYFEQVKAAIGGGLSMARYQPDLYLIAGEVESKRQKVTSGLLLSMLLKRYESSLESFRRTLKKMIGSHDRFIEILDRGYVAVPSISPEAFAEDDHGGLEGTEARPSHPEAGLALRATHPEPHQGG